MPDLIGQRIGQYEIVALLGKGGMAEVYRARQALAGGVTRDVAFKLIDAHLAAAPEFIARFKREAQTLISLSHPHILKAFDFGQYEDTVYLVMELLAGGSLTQLINRGPLPLGTTIQVLDQIAQALDYAHGKGLVHRDLKPQNVLLDESGNAFLTDFGIVKLLNEGTVLTQSQTAIGTPAYMAPEQWTGDTIDARADLYSLGVMLFEMLIGHVPFRGDTPHRIMYQHISEAPPPVHTLRADVPPAVDQVIAKALSKNPADRYSSAGALRDAFKAALSEQTSVVPERSDRPERRAIPQSSPPPPSTTVSVAPPAVDKAQLSKVSPRSSNRTLVISVAVVIVLVLVGLGGGLAISQAGRSGASTLTPTAIPSKLPEVAIVTTSAPLVALVATLSSPTVSSTRLSVQAADTTTMIASSTPLPPTNTATYTATATNTSPPPTATSTATPHPTTTPPPPTATPRPTVTPIPLTVTPNPTDTPIPPTDTPNPTGTPIPPTATPKSTDTPIPPTDTPNPTDTPIQPTVAEVAATQAPASIASVTTNEQWQPTTQSFNGVTMALVPPGCFQMGSTTGDSDEQPVTKICFSKPFWIDTLEVSQAQFSTLGGTAADTPGFPGDNHPIEDLSWAEARDYCALRDGRLPTEAEWEYAARGPSDLVYPWGNTFVADNVVYKANSNGQTADVGSKPDGASWVGALDMSGNVWEWTSSLYLSYPYSADDGREATTNASGNLRVVRGGSWYDDERAARTSARNALDPSSTNGDVGVRCVKDY